MSKEVEKIIIVCQSPLGSYTLIFDEHLDRAEGSIEERQAWGELAGVITLYSDGTKSTEYYEAWGA